MKYIDRENLMQEDEITISLDGTGKSKNEALGNVFSKLRKDIYDKVDGYILYMEPKQVFMDKCDVKKYTERFMFIFMPREKEEVCLKVTIVVKVKYIKF